MPALFVLAIILLCVAAGFGMLSLMTRHRVPATDGTELAPADAGAGQSFQQRLGDDEVHHLPVAEALQRQPE